MAEEEMEKAYFTVVDYIILALVLLVSLGIGVYHSIKGNKTTDDFLLASRSLSPVPVACSLVASFLSSVSILGFTAETYAFGASICWMMFGLTCGLIVTINIIVPVFYDLQMKSVNEYIILRFKSPALMYMMLIINSINQLLLLGIILYATSLALAAVTPISTDIYVLITGVAATLYCSIGGMKAVVWTDLFQAIILLVGVILVTASSIWKAGGLANVWHIASENGRLEFFDMRLGLYERQTAINSFILGMTTYGYTFSFHQAAVQRFTTQRSLRSAKGVMYGGLVGLCITLTIIFVGGIGIYAVYHGCDPLALGIVKKMDQIMPYYVMQHLGFLTAVPGLFVACLFCGTLSSISSMLNAVPTMVWSDFLAELPYFQKASERTRTLINKLITLLLGLVMIGLAFLAARAQGLLRVAIAVYSVSTGPITGVFVMGLAVPVVGKKGAIAGFLSSMGFLAWIVFGAQLYGEATPRLPLQTHLCENSNVSLNLNFATEIPQSATPTPETSHPLWFLYNISYAYFSAIGIIGCLAVGVAVTFATGCEELSSVKPEHVLQCLKSKVGNINQKTSMELKSCHGDAHISEQIESISKAKVTSGTKGKNVTKP